MSTGSRVDLFGKKASGLARASIAAVRAMLRSAAAILGQCGIALRKVSVHYQQAGRHLVADTRRSVPFAAEAFAPANAAQYPSLADTVWITRGTRSPGIALAHELVHVLTDSGEHSSAPENLMREETAPENTNLTADQCGHIPRSGTARGLLADPR